MVCTTYLDSMLTGKIDYSESKSIYHNNIIYLKLIMIRFKERNKEITNRFLGELSKNIHKN